MCGICGVIGYPNGGQLIRQMAAAMFHRGPDSGGYLERPPVWLGIRRLRIVDLYTGDQPIWNGGWDDGNCF